MTTFFLIRHGQNDFVTGKNQKLAGWLPDVHLNAAGRAQAAALADLLAPIKLKAVYSSPLDRTMETAAPIAKAQRLEVIPMDGLGEIRYGKWEGKTLRALRRRKLWPVIQNNPSLARFPDGESFPEAQARVVAALESLRARHRGKRAAVACVSHADVIKLAVAHYLGLPLDLFQRLVILPASISVLHVGEGAARLIQLNDSRATEARARE